MIPVVVVLVYLVIIAYIGSVAYRKGKANTEDFFLAGRSIGPIVFFLSIFATNMTAFAILGSSGIAYKRGIGVFGLMASSSGSSSSSSSKSYAVGYAIIKRKSRSSGDE